MNLYHNRIVVKAGTSTLTNELGQSSFRAFDNLACVISDVQNMGYEVILVSSGAIAVGANKMNLKQKPDSIRFKQAAASVGQCRIIHLYSKYFQEYDKVIGQILLSSADVANERKKENLINTFNTLLEVGIIPVVNANDSVSYEEIQSEEQLFGDNDMLSAIVAVLCQADKLVIFSDIDGLYDSDPHQNPQARLIPQINAITDDLYRIAGGAGSRRGTGGMRTKLKAAKLATEQGIDTIITNGSNPQALYRIINGESAGTLFAGRVR
ncbi:MAG: glutamate 5-kinase [Lachnospiraceae bacterium]|nr:glutamate 5-kinase [Lachnospiraceae bacterium]